MVVSIDPETLLLDEGIGAVDADFLDRARARLHTFVDRAGILVFASHTEQLRTDFCSSALWLDTGRIARSGPDREVIASYHGHSAATVST